MNPTGRIFPVGVRFVCHDVYQSLENISRV